MSDHPKNITENQSTSAGPALPLNLRELERNAIVAALQVAGGNRVEAARLLGIGKTTIYRKIKDYALKEA
jgi:transcriptional regulator of acetoin/glycerol metabolism